MSASLQKVSDAAWALSGEITPGNAVEVRSAGERLLKDSAVQIQVDLAGITRSTSAAISVLLCWMREAEHQKKKLVFAHMPDKMFDVARVSGLDSVLPRQI